MKLLFTLLFSLYATALVAQDKPNKFALIVAISRYKPGTGWNNLASEKDIPLIRDALKKQGFPEQNIVVLRDQQATKEGILNGIQKHLIDKAKPGDICVFHFSGHGQQVYDNNGDEADGYDEALVTYDSPMDYVPGVERHLRDDDFGLKLEEVRRKLGDNGELIVLVDACHSGSGTRNNPPPTTHRGTTKAYAPKNYAGPASGVNKVDDKLFGLGDRRQGLAPMIAFFASRSMELNYQVKVKDEEYGSLSMAFFKVVNNATEQMSYKTISDRIKVQIRNWGLPQNPDAEGELDKLIFGGNLLTKADYYVPLDVKGREITISTGLIYNVFEGSTIRVYPSDTRDTFGVAPLATGTIIKAENFQSVVKLNEAIDPAVLTDSWVFLDEINFGDLQAGVFLKNIPDAARARLEAVLGRIKEVKLSQVPASLNVETISGDDGNSYYVFKHEQEAFLRLPVNMDDGRLADTLQYRLRHYAWSRYFLQLNKVDPNIRVSFKMLPVKVTKRNERGGIAETQDLPESSIRDKNGNIVMAVGEAYN
ncbi:MAG TPA: caspase family protein, partial [Lacibacter sp.]|nr:caspase family protein [Lacibacter sp.]